MKALFGLFASVSLLPTGALAEPTMAVAPPADVAVVSCSISSDASSRGVSLTVLGSSAIAGISGGVVARITTSPSRDGGPPDVTAHAIKTKGAGANDRKAVPNVKHPELMRALAPSGDGGKAATTTKGCDGSQRTAATAGATACSVSADGLSVSVSGLLLPSSSKVSIQDLHFVSSSDATVVAAGAGGGPHVRQCSGVDGAPSDVTMLLLPAVQK